MKTALISTCVAALMAVAGIAVAQSPQRAPRADADGRVSQAEFLSRLDRMAAADADRDGSVTPAERQAAMQTRMAERRAAAFARLDADGNGAISRAEFDARPQRGERAEGDAHGRMGRGEGRGHRGGGDSAMRGDQTVNLAQARERMTQAFARLDKNSDGYLTAEERRDDRTQRREHRREMRRPSPTAPASE